MTANEAIERIKKRICCENPIQHFCTDNCMHGFSECEFSLAIYALKKQVPIKIKIVDGNDLCPRCGYSFGKDSVRMQLSHWRKDHCDGCGQALDWSDLK